MTPQSLPPNVVGTMLLGAACRGAFISRLQPRWQLHHGRSPTLEAGLAGNQLFEALPLVGRQ